MAELKNHHYIPKSYLRNFSFQKNKDYYAFVRYMNEKTYETNIRNICSENYFYSIPGLSANNKNIIEKYYANSIDNLYPEITEIITNDSITQLTVDQRKKILSCSLNLYFRTPKFLKYCSEHIKKLENIFDEYHLGKNERYKVNFFDSKIDLRQIDYSKFKSKIGDKSKQLFLIQHIKIFNDFVDYKHDDGIAVYKIEDESEFITSDNPIIIRNANGTLDNIFAYDNVIYLPINNKYLITITPKSEASLQNTFLRISADFDFVMTINYDIDKNSDKWIIGSENSISSHLDLMEQTKETTEDNMRIFERAEKKHVIMQKLSKLLDKSDGKLTNEVIEELKKASKTEIMKDDVNMIRYMNELKANGYIK